MYSADFSVDEYQAFEKQSRSDFNRRTIDGKLVGCSKCVGYCRYDGHTGFLTDKLRKEHSCCEKGCNYYVQKPHRVKDDNLEKERSTVIMQAALTATSVFEGMRLIGISSFTESSCVLRYATLSDCYPIRAIETSLSESLGIMVKMNKMDCDYDVAAKLIFG